MSNLEQAALIALPDAMKRAPSASSFELELWFATEAELEAQRQRIAEYRVRVEGIEDKELRAAYIRWLDYFQRENDEAWEEARFHRRRDAWRAQKMKRDRENAAIEVLVQSIQKP